MRASPLPRITRAAARLALFSILFAPLAVAQPTAPNAQTAETVFRDARAYTVRIRTQISTPFLEDERGSFSGAGFLVDAERRWVVTNAHVVGYSPAVVLTAFADGKFRPARKIYVDSFTDMAVLEVAPDGQKHVVAPINCTESPQVGEAVGAFGHPLGLPFTGTRGIISGKTDKFLYDLLQIDATVDHGNSGGPVISLRDGRIVGIATAMLGDSKADRTNFATPMKDVCRILELLRNGVAPEPPQMEFSLLVDEDCNRTLIVGTTHNPSRWPFQPGDRIVAVGAEAQPVKTLTEFVTALRGRVGSVPIRVERGGREMDIQAKPTPRPSVLDRRAVYIDGAVISGVAIEDAAALREPARLVVHSVQPGSAAEAVVIVQMDVVQTIDGRRFDDLDSLIAYLERHPRGTPIRIVLRRMSPSLNRWFEYQVRDLPGENTLVIGPESKLLTSRH